MPDYSGGVYLDRGGPEVHAITGYAAGILLGLPEAALPRLDVVLGLSPVPG